MLEAPESHNQEQDLPRYLKLSLSDDSGYWRCTEWQRKVFYLFAHPASAQDKLFVDLLGHNFKKTDAPIALFAILKLCRMGHCDIKILRAAYSQYFYGSRDTNSGMPVRRGRKNDILVRSTSFKLAILMLVHNEDHIAALDGLKLVPSGLAEYKMLHELLPIDVFNAHFLRSLCRLAADDESLLAFMAQCMGGQGSDREIRAPAPARPVHRILSAQWPVNFDPAKETPYRKNLAKIIAELKQSPEKLARILEQASAYSMILSDIETVKTILDRKPHLVPLYYSCLVTKRLSDRLDMLDKVAELFPFKLYKALVNGSIVPDSELNKTGAGASAGAGGAVEVVCSELDLADCHINSIVKLLNVLIKKGVAVNLAHFESHLFKVEFPSQIAEIVELYVLSSTRLGGSILTGVSSVVHALMRSQPVIREFPIEFFGEMSAKIAGFTKERDKTVWADCPADYLRDFIVIYTQDSLNIASIVDVEPEVTPEEAFSLVKGYLNLLQSAGLEVDIANAIKECLFNWQSIVQDLDAAHFANVIALLDRYAVVYCDFAPEESCVKSNSVAACFLSQRQVASVPTSTEDKISVLEMQKQQLEAVFTDPEPLPVFKRIAFEAQLKEINRQLKELSSECTAIVVL